MATEISVRFLENFGTVSATSMTPLAVGGPVSVPDSDGNSYYKGQVPVYPIALAQGQGLLVGWGSAAFAPVNLHSQVLRSGWNPASVLVANNFVSYDTLNKYSQMYNGVAPDNAMEIAAAVWCLHFQDVGSQIHVPLMSVTVTEKAPPAEGRAPSVISSNSTIVGGFDKSWAETLDWLGQLSIREGKTSELSAISGPHPIQTDNVTSAIVKVDLDTIGSTKKVANYNSYELILNWGYWSVTSDDMGHQTAYMPIPPGSFNLTVKSGKTNVNFRTAPSITSKVIKQLNAGKSLLQTLPIDSAGWWGAIDESGNNGFITGDLVDITPVSYVTGSPVGVKTLSPSGAEITATGGATPAVSKTTATTPTVGTKPATQTNATNWPLYGGIAAGVFVLGGAVYFLMRKK